jgi:hypothetical protein
MATRYWKSTSSTALATTTNWTGSGVLTTDDLIIDLSGSAAAVAAGVPSNVVSAIATGTLSCNSLTVVDTASKPLVITGTSSITIGTASSGGQFIITANTQWNHTGTINLQGNTTNTFFIGTNGAVIQALISIGGTGYTGGTYKLTSLTKTSKTVTLNYGVLDISTNDLWCGIFSSSSTNTRSIQFGTSGKGIYLDNSATATIFNMAIGGNFSYTGTSKVIVTNSGSAATKTISTVGLSSSSVALNFYFSDTNKTNSNIIAVSTGSYFLDFDATNWNTAGSFTNSARTIFGNLNLCSSTTWTGTTTSYITTFINGNSTSAQIVNYANASGVGPVTFVANNSTYPINVTGTLNSIGAIVFNGNGTINLSSVIAGLAFTHSGPTVNTNTSGISSTTYTLSSGTLNIVSPNYFTVSCSGAFTLSGGTLKFADTAYQSLSCFNFIYTAGTFIGVGNGNSALPQQIEVNGRISSNTVAITGTPTVIGNVGFYVDYNGTSTVTVSDTSGVLNYSFNTAPISIANCIFKGLDVTYQSSNIVLSNTNSLTINGPFYDGGYNVYKTTATNSTNSTATIYLNGGTQAVPVPLYFDSVSALNLYIDGFYETQSQNFPVGTVTSIFVNNNRFLNLSYCTFTVSTFTLGTNATLEHDSNTSIVVVGLGNSTGSYVFYAGAGNIVSIDDTAGTITLQAPGTVTTNLRYVGLPISKASQCLNIYFANPNPKDRVTITGTCGLLDAGWYQGTLDISTLNCAAYNTLQTPYVPLLGRINIFTDETTINNSGVLGIVYLNNANLSGLNLYVTGSGSAELIYTSTTPFNLYLRNTVYVTVPGFNFQTLDIGDSSTFNHASSSAPHIFIGGGASTYKCSSTATLIDFHSVKFNSYNSYFYTGGKHYDTLEVSTGVQVLLFDDKALIDNLILNGSTTLIIKSDKTTITSITAPSTNLSTSSVVFNNTTRGTTFNFSTINSLSANTLYFRTDEFTAYPVTIKFDTPLKVGLYSSVYPSNTNIKLVSTGYSVYNFATLGTYQAGPKTYDPAQIIFLYTGNGSGNFFLMF